MINASDGSVCLEGWTLDRGLLEGEYLRVFPKDEEPDVNAGFASYGFATAQWGMVVVFYRGALVHVRMRYQPNRAATADEDTLEVDEQERLAKHNRLIATWLGLRPPSAGVRAAQTLERRFAWRQADSERDPKTGAAVLCVTYREYPA